MYDYSEQQLVGMAMRKYGGGFAESLAWLLCMLTLTTVNALNLRFLSCGINI